MWHLRADPAGSFAAAAVVNFAQQQLAATFTVVLPVALRQQQQLQRVSFQSPGRLELAAS